MTPLTEVDQLKAQNALLLRRLLVVSRERDALLKRIEAIEPPALRPDTPVADARVAR